MLSLIVFLPLAAAVLLAALPGIGARAAGWAWVGATLVDLALVAVVWAGFRPPATGRLAFEEQVATHGGLGGPQMRPFVAWPPECPLAPETLDDAQDFYPYFARYSTEDE